MDSRPAATSANSTRSSALGSSPSARTDASARVVKAFNTLYFKNIEADPSVKDGHRVLFISGDDAEAKAIVADLLKSLGFAPIDIGGLVEGGRMQQLDGPLASHNLIKL